MPTQILLIAIHFINHSHLKIVSSLSNKHHKIKPNFLNITTHHILVTKQARYSSYGLLTAKTKYFWFALHGTKMFCEQMLYKFQDFNPDEHFVIAPEGLSRFYLKGFGGDVVATWMTSRDRLKEIEDLSNYLSKLYNLYTAQLPAGCTKTVIGFSQGGTTALRWLHNTAVKLDFLINYSAWIPEDIDFRQAQTELPAVKKIYTYGTEDEFLTTERVAAVRTVIDKSGLNFNMHAYKGTHRIEKQQLKFLFEKYIDLY